VLEGLGFAGIELHAYPNMPHSLCAQEQADIVEFIDKARPLSFRDRSVQDCVSQLLTRPVPRRFCHRPTISRSGPND
jgi:hypothetical protein